MWQWIKFSLRVWAAYWTGWIVVSLMLLAVSVLALAAITALNVLLQ